MGYPPAHEIMHKAASLHPEDASEEKNSGWQQGEGVASGLNLVSLAEAENLTGDKSTESKDLSPDTEKTSPEKEDSESPSAEACPTDDTLGNGLEPCKRENTDIHFDGLNAIGGDDHPSFVQDEVGKVPSWRELSPVAKIQPGDGAFYYRFRVKNGSEIHLVVAPVNSASWDFKPAVAERLAPTSQQSRSRQASLGVNGGYFSLRDGKSISYVTIDGVTVEDPSKNEALTKNPGLKPYLHAILNRSEVRFLEDAKGQEEIQIATHEAALPDGDKLRHAIQAGPQILPKITAEEEAFVRKQADGTTVDAIRTTSPAARSAIGLTPDNFVMVACVAGKGQDQESSGLTLVSMASVMRQLGCNKALNFDGGASTTMFAKLKAQGQKVCGKDPETNVKSILMLLPSRR